MIGKTTEVCLKKILAELTLIKNKTLVKNMEHVKWDQIPPLRGPDPQGLNVSIKQSTTTENSEKLNGRYRQNSTKRRD